MIGVCEDDNTHMIINMMFDPTAVTSEVKSTKIFWYFFIRILLQIRKLWFILMIR